MATVVTSSQGGGGGVGGELAGATHVRTTGGAIGDRVGLGVVHQVGLGLDAVGGACAAAAPFGAGARGGGGGGKVTGVTGAAAVLAAASAAAGLKVGQRDERRPVAPVPRDGPEALDRVAVDALVRQAAVATFGEEVHPSGVGAHDGGHAECGEVVRGADVEPKCGSAKEPHFVRRAHGQQGADCRRQAAEDPVGGADRAAASAFDEGLQVKWDGDDAAPGFRRGHGPHRAGVDHGLADDGGVGGQCQAALAGAQEGRWAGTRTN